MSAKGGRTELHEGKRRTPIRSLPRVPCDFNSVGWSGEEDDECYYSFDEGALDGHRLRNGMRVFIYENSRDNLVMGCEAALEQYLHPVTEQLQWRMRAVPNTAYLGQLDE